MSTPYEIPLSAAAQTFKIDLAGTTYQLRVYWSEASQCWMLDIADASQVPVINGLALVTGVNLLEPYEYLGFTSSLEVQTDHDTFAVPDFNSLGTTGHLYFITP